MTQMPIDRRIQIAEGGYEIVRALRYGENQRQANASLLRAPHREHDPLALDTFKQIEGEGPSFINMTDLHRLIEMGTRIGACLFGQFGFVPYIAIAVKHGNACGAAIASDPQRAIENMIAGDSQAISGGSILVNFAVNAEHAYALRRYKVEGGGERILDGVAAPSFSGKATDILARKTGKCRMFTNPALAEDGLDNIDTSTRYRHVRGGLLVQDGDPFVLEIPTEWNVSSSHIQQDIILGWGIGSTSTSNSVVLVKDRMLIGIGLAQPSRVRACKVAIMSAQECGHDLHDSVAYSDSYFPLPDGPEALAQVGVSTIFATSGAIRDDYVRSVCEQRGVQLLQLPDVEARGFYGH